MQLSLESLRKLDPKDIGSWPALVQIIVLTLIMVAVVAVGYFLVLDPQRELLKEGQAKEEGLKQSFLEKKAKAINLEAYKQQLAEIQQTFGALLKQLPSKAEMETLITEINQSGVGRGLQFDLFKPASSETRNPEFAERPVDLKIVGSYHDLAAFASDIAQLSRIVTLANVQLTPGPANAVIQPGSSGSTLTMQAVAKTYRALDAEEAVEMRKAEADKKKKK